MLCVLVALGSWLGVRPQSLGHIICLSLSFSLFLFSFTFFLLIRSVQQFVYWTIVVKRFRMRVARLARASSSIAAALLFSSFLFFFFSRHNFIFSLSNKDNSLQRYIVVVFSGCQWFSTLLEESEMTDDDDRWKANSLVVQTRWSDRKKNRHRKRGKEPKGNPVEANWGFLDKVFSIFLFYFVVVSIFSSRTFFFPSLSLRCRCVFQL